MVIAVIGSGSHHGFCNALGVPNDEQAEVHAPAGALTNCTGRAILEARAEQGASPLPVGAALDAYSVAPTGSDSM